jgi:hypothetical protein
MLLFIIPLFIPLNISDSYLVEELNMHNINNKIIKDAFKDALFFINLLRFLLKG